MKVTKNMSKLLALSYQEELILKSLTEVTSPATLLQKKVSLPRATVDRTLKALHHRGLIQKRKYSKRRSGWVVNGTGDIFSQLFFNFSGTNGDRVAVKHYSGLDEMKQIKEDFILKSKNTRHFAVQSNEAWIAWKDRLEPEEFEEYNQLLAKNKIMLDVILPDTVEPLLLENAYEGRPSLAHSIPNKYLKGEVDIEVAEDAVFFMNWRNLQGVRLTDKAIAVRVRGLIEYIRDNADSYNIHKIKQGSGKIL